ncbi:MAG TPA: hypothetical protein VHV08_04690, partial [Pirellulales bacterium]|nr:hypothetical protein [Pirellulales bacterium]
MGNASKGESRLRLSEERGRALLTILLTNRQDLVVRDEPLDIGLDYMVAIDDPAKRGVRRFGIGMKATEQPTTKVRVKDWVKEIRRHGPFPFPVILAVVEIRQADLMYSWVTAPTKRGSGVKLTDAEPELAALTDATLQVIV